MTAVLALEHVTKRVGTGRTLFSDVGFTIQQGQRVAVCGRSGSGKSTLLNLAGGMDLAFDGVISVEGRSLAALSDEERSAIRRTRVGLVFQAFHLLDHLTLLSNVMLPARFCPPSEKHGLLDRARGLLDAVGLSSRAADTPSTLSGGERQRVAIARALVMQPRLLLADEPTGNLDRSTADGVLELFTRLSTQHGAAVLLVTHDPVVAATAQRTLWLRDGALQEAA
jgi:putative ABC transport system ATP-binding protein